MPDFSLVAQLGIAGVSVVGLLWFVFNTTSKLIDSYNANTKALNKVSLVTEKALERDLAFQQEILRISRDTNEKVKDIHKVIS